jgi:hypothetical protein
MADAKDHTINATRSQETELMGDKWLSIHLDEGFGQLLRKRSESGAQPAAENRNRR